MVSYWRLNETTQPFQDYLTSHSGGCPVNCPTPAAGIIEGGQLFNGIDTGISISATPAFDWNAGDSFSIEFWLQRDGIDFSGFEVLIGREDEASPMQWWIGINSVGMAEFSLIDQNGNGPVETITGNTPLLDGKWHHVVLVRDGTNNKTLLYVDGTPDTTPQEFTYPAGFHSSTNPINIGWLQSGDFHYGGSLDEIAIYNAALSDFEIRQHQIDGTQGLSLGYCYDGTPIRIMPLGDSITRGTSTTITDANYIVGYRQKLFRTLQSYGYSVDFVGSGQSGSLAMPPLDPDHEGHPIWTAAQVASNVYSWLAGNPADIILLHIGTNNGSSDSVRDVEFLLDEIDRYSEDIVVLLARIINRQTLSTATTIFNDNVESMAMARIANGDKIIMVDQEGALFYPNDIADDNLHPTKVGYEKMADTWFSALEGVLPTANSLPVLAFSEELVALKATQGVFPNTQSVSLDTIDGVPATFTLTSDSIWLDITTNESVTPATVTFSVGSANSPVGIYTAYVTASSPEYIDAVIKITFLVTTANSNYQLFQSFLPDHTDSQLLHGSTLNGEVYVFASPETDIYNVTFYLDHDFQRLESYAPFDFAGNSSYNTMQLANGEHEITALVKKLNGQNEVISSTFTVHNLITGLTFDRSSLDFNSIEGNLPQNHIINIGTSDLTAADYTIVTDVDWLALTPVSGTTPAAVTASVTDTTLAPGVYGATVTATANGYNSAQLSVQYTVASSGSGIYNLLLSASPDRSAPVTLDGTTVSGNIFVFTGPDTGVKQVTFSLDGTVVKTEGYGPFDFAGTAVNNAAIPYDTTLLADGQHVISALISLTDGSSEVINNTFTVNNNIPALTVDLDNIVFEALEGNLPFEQTINLSTSDGLGADYTISTNATWLTVSPATGTSPATVTVSVTDSTLAPGIYNATITAAAGGYVNATVAVKYTVSGIGGSMYSLLLSASPDRSAPVTLNGTTVSGNIFVFTGPDTGVKQVTFSLDGTVVKTEGYGPFDFAGTAVNNDAIPYDTTLLADGQHVISALISLTDGSSEVINNTFTVNNNIPALTVDLDNIVFEALEGNLPFEQTINLSTSDGLGADYTISTSATWLTVSPATGTSPATVTVSVTDSTLAPGIYNATITAAAGGYVNATVAVKYTVSGIGGSMYNLLLSASPDRSAPVTLNGTTVSGNIFVFTGPDTGVKQVTFSLDGTVVKTEGYGPFDFAGTAVNNAAIPYDTTLLADGQHVISALISLTDGSSEVINNTFTVNNNIPALTVDLDNIVFEALEGNLPFEQTINLSTSDGLGADYTISTNATWLTVSPATGTSPATVTVSVTDSTLAPGIYNATITAAAGGYVNATVAVKYTVSGIGGSMYSLLLSASPDRSAPVTLNGTTVSGNIFVFTGPDTGVKQVTFSLDGTVVKTEGYGPFDFAGTAVNNDAIPYDTTLLADGQHVISALISLTDGSSEVINNTFTVNNNIPALTVDLDNIVFEALEGNLPFEQTINLSTSDGLGADYTISTSATWLTVSPATGTSPATVTVSVTDSTLAPGIYNATITAAAGGYVNATVAVKYTVSGIGGSMYNLLLSASPDRSAPVTLNGTTVSGNIFVFTGPDTGVKQVTFSLDGTVVKTEGFGPFDFAGTAVNNTAIPYDTTLLADGQHVISALISLTDGSSEVINSVFMVSN
jgi:uncharacterized membrane protein